MAERQRAGCGCIPLILLFVFVIPLVLNVGRGILGDDRDFELGADVVGLLVGLAVVVMLVALFRRVARNRDAEDVLADGRPTSTGSRSRRSPRTPGPSPESSAPPRSRPAPASSRPATRSSPPAESPAESSVEETETRVLRQRLTEAVADISSGRRYTADERGRPLTSSEMIERAKRSIADWEHRH